MSGSGMFEGLEGAVEPGSASEQYESGSFGYNPKLIQGLFGLFEDGPERPNYRKLSGTSLAGTAAYGIGVGVLGASPSSLAAIIGAAAGAGSAEAALGLSSYRSAKKGAKTTKQADVSAPGFNITSVFPNYMKWDSREHGRLLESIGTMLAEDAAGIEDADSFLDAAITQLLLSDHASDSRFFHLFMDALVQALYDRGHNGFHLDYSHLGSQGLRESDVGYRLRGSAERPLMVSYAGELLNIGLEAEHAEFHVCGHVAALVPSFFERGNRLYLHQGEDVEEVLPR